MKGKNAIVFLTITPKDSLIEFMKELPNDKHDVFLCIDNEKYDIIENKSKFGSVIPISYSHELCSEKGYKKMVFYWICKFPCAWEKAFYHFCAIDTTYDNVWFVEDDVFVTTKTAMADIDLKYPASDLLSIDNITEFGDNWALNWKQFCEGYFPRPWYRSMVCACRLSRTLLNLISAWVSEKGCLQNHEVFFHTLAKHNLLKVDCPEELDGILYRNLWKEDDFKAGHLYHDVKNCDIHESIRIYMRKKRLMN
jgi:hypothetical protein